MPRKGKRDYTMAWERGPGFSDGCPSAAEPQPEKNFSLRSGTISPGGCWKWSSWIDSKNGNQVGFWAATRKGGKKAKSSASRKRSSSTAGFYDPSEMSYKRGGSGRGRQCFHGWPCGKSCVQASQLAKCKYPNADPWRAAGARAAYDNNNNYSASSFMAPVNVNNNNDFGGSSDFVPTVRSKKKRAGTQRLGLGGDYMAYKFPGAPTPYGRQCKHGYPCGRTCVTLDRARNCKAGPAWGY